MRACSCAAKSLFVSRFQFMLARFKFHFSFCGCPFFSNSSGMVIWSSSKGRVLVASNRPPFVLIRSYIWIQAALLRIAAPAKLPHVILRALPRFRYFPHAIPGVWSATIINHDYTPIIMRAQLRTYSLLNSLIYLLLSSLCSQSATCSFLFRVILLLTVVN